MPGFEPIPGETPIDDISGLIPRSITTRQQLSTVEAENILKAVVHYLASQPSRRKAPFTLAWCLKLHKQMFGDVWKWAGELRQCELNLGVQVYRIQTDLATLLDDLHYWQAHAAMDLVEQATRLHHRAVTIHPFLNGNGRWARMLANILLRRQGHPVVRWPDQTIGQESVIRGEYLDAIRSADGGDYAPLLVMHQKYSGT